MACYGSGSANALISLPAGTVDINGNDTLNCCDCPGGGGGGGGNVVLTCSDPTACNYNEVGTCIMPIIQACERYAITITPGFCAVRTWSAAGFDLNDYYGLPCGEEYPDPAGLLSCTFVMPRLTIGCITVTVSNSNGAGCAGYVKDPLVATARIQRVGPSLCLGNGETSCYQEAGEHDVFLYGYGSITLCSSPCTAGSCDAGCVSPGCV